MVNSKIVIIETTVSSNKDAKKLANTLLDQKLIACANITKTQSVYNWKNKKYDETEFLVSIKTSKDKKQIAIQSIKKIHPYELPMIVVKEIETTKEYQEWIEK